MAKGKKTEKAVEGEPSVENEMTEKIEETERTTSPKPTTEAAEKKTATTTEAASSSSAPAASSAMNDRMARFKALQARSKTSLDQNIQAAAAEVQALSTDASQLSSLRRRQRVAEHKLLKADVEEAGGDFERKRAWDWTAEESEKWDRRMRKKAARRDNNAFQDYRQEANKVYKRQLRQHANLAAPDLAAYTREKLAAIERAAAAGTLELVETEDGELLAVDKDGSFYGGSGIGTGNGSGGGSGFDNKPSKEAIDRLVRDQEKAEEVAARRRSERRAKNGEDADVTYINEKNKDFNQKLARFYNKYTAEIRESFERGTMV